MFDHYFDFNGRIGRMTYFINTLKFIGAVLLFALLFGLLLFGMSLVSKWASIALGVAGLAAYLYYTLKFSFSQGAKRAHDLGHSGWVSVLLAVPVVATIASLYFFFAPGQEGANAYGEPESR